LSWTSYFLKKKILITGAGNGIGRGLAISLSKYCDSLILIDIDITGLEETVSLCSTDASCEQLVLDLRHAENCHKALSNVPCPDIIIANAGLGGLNPANGFSTQIDHQIMSVNYFGTVNCIAPFLSSMIQRGSGHIVGMCSLAAMRGLLHGTSYSASKAAQMSFLESLRLELQPKGIHVTTLLPGFIKTQMADHEEFPMPFTISVEQCVDISLRSIAGQRKQALFPFPMRILATINRFLPIWLYDPIMRLINKDQKTQPQIFSNINTSEESQIPPHK
jgi:short-subunit dehydrogenase